MAWGGGKRGKSVCVRWFRSRVTDKFAGRKNVFEDEFLAVGKKGKGFRFIFGVREKLGEKRAMKDEGISI